ncbi:hypothetical protein SAMN05192544_10424 [Paraburkholderia hospita]|jgi:hypothetical protein|nr:hypothetical protein SAMN05192544_10424 [Paraburkholderia hospita]
MRTPGHQGSLAHSVDRTSGRPLHTDSRPFNRCWCKTRVDNARVHGLAPTGQHLVNLCRDPASEKLVFRSLQCPLCVTRWVWCVKLAANLPQGGAAPLNVLLLWLCLARRAKFSFFYAHRCRVTARL